MARYRCSVCGYVHDESKEGASWSSLPDSWTCPVCGATKGQFESEPNDFPTRDSPPPKPAGPKRRAIAAHRVFGYIFLAIYVLLMWQMVPRLWAYQIEFPARTVVHISLGMAIGVVLVLKIAIVRFFQRLEQSLVPMLGTMLLVGSVVLIGISIPTAFRETLAAGKSFAAENQERVRELLAQTGLEKAECTRFASAESLRAGQRVLRDKCIDCHDLRTVLAKPRTPENWRQTVRRMADRTTMFNPLKEDEQWQVTAYLIALSPQLQMSARQMRDAGERRETAQKAAQAVVRDEAETAAYDPFLAQQLFEFKCSQCHETRLVADAPPASEQEARNLVASMVDEGLEATEGELAQIVRYLTEFHTKSPE